MKKLFIFQLLYSTIFSVTSYCEIPERSNYYKLEIEKKDFEFRYHYYNTFDELIKTESYRIDKNGLKGQKTAEINYKDGRLHDLYTSYCINGDIQLELLFNSNRLVEGRYESTGCKNEPWIDRVEINAYRNNVEFVEYSNYTNWIVSKKTYENDFSELRLNGIVEEYFNDKLSYEGYYSYGQRVGLHIYYYPNGDIEKIEGDFELVDINTDNNISLHDIVILIECIKNQECALNYYNQMNHLDLISIADNILEK